MPGATISMVGNDWPRITVRLIASTSIERNIASRTRLFLERVLALDVGLDQLVAFGVEAEIDDTGLGALQNLDIGVFLQGLGVGRRDLIGHVDVARLQRRDAGRRVATGVKITSVRLWVGLSHHFGLGTRTVFSPALRSFSMKGPVPMALRVA